MKIKESSYSKLVIKLKKEMTKGFIKAQQAYDKQRVVTYWNIGKIINNHFLKHRVQAEFGKRIFINLSNDLKLAETLLYQITAFYKAYPVLKDSLNLKWSHYRLLSYVKDDSKRKELEIKVSEENLSNRNLADLMKKYKTWFPEKEKNVQTEKHIEQLKLKTFRGKLYHYKIFKSHFSNKYLIDCGFNIFRETDLTSYKGLCVHSFKKGDEYLYKPSNVHKRYMYAYKAYIEKIIDGDTIWFHIDLGFNTWTRQSLRFMWIEAEPKGTKQGKLAYQYLLKVLRGLSFVVIKSYRTEKHGRYLTDIFYLKDEFDPQIILEKGNFLNQEMLDKGLVKLYE